MTKLVDSTFKKKKIMIIKIKTMVGQNCIDRVKCLEPHIPNDSISTVRDLHMVFLQSKQAIER